MYKIVSIDKEIACKQSPHNVLMTMKFVFGRIIHENKNDDVIEYSSFQKFVSEYFEGKSIQENLYKMLSFQFPYITFSSLFFVLSSYLDRNISLKRLIQGSIKHTFYGSTIQLRKKDPNMSMRKGVESHHSIDLIPLLTLQDDQIVYVYIRYCLLLYYMETNGFQYKYITKRQFFSSTTVYSSIEKEWIEGVLL